MTGAEKEMERASTVLIPQLPSRNDDSETRKRRDHKDPRLFTNVEALQSTPTVTG